MVHCSRIIAGTMTWGKWGKDLSTNEMASLIELYLTNGINTFDHADIYGGYTTEAAFGEAFKSSGATREDVVLISKCGIQYPSENRPLQIKHYNYTAEHIIWSVENSLRNLRTDYLDVLLLHRPSPLMVAEEISVTIEKLNTSGKIRDFGVSNFTPSQTEIIQKYIPVSFNQIQFSLTHPEAMTDGSLDHMQLNGIRPMAWNPLGIIFREDTPQTLRLRPLLKRLEEKYNSPAEIIMLSWILMHPAEILPVCGTTTPDRISLLMKAQSLKLDLEDWFSLWVESRGQKVP